MTEPLRTPKKKPYFAQAGTLGATARYFFDREEARNWLAANGGGSLKKRNRHTGWDLVETVEVKEEGAT